MAGVLPSGCVANAPSDARRLTDFLAKKCKRHISQQVIEDGFNVLKSSVSKKANSTATPTYAWSHLVDKAVLSNKYHFNEVPRLPSLPARAPAFAPETWTPVMSRSKQDDCIKSAELYRIVGFGDCEWYSPGAVGYLGPLADLEAARQAHSQGALARLGHRDYCRLLNKNMIVRKNTDPEDVWFFGVGNCDGTIAITWPARQVGEGQYIADIAKNRSLHAIFSPDDWTAQPVKWISPLHRAFLKQADEQKAGPTDDVHVKAAHHYDAMEIVAVTTGPASSLWQVAAAAAFYDLPLTFLRELCARRDIEVDDVTLLTTLEAMYRNAYPDASTEDVIAMLDRRSVTFQSSMTHVNDLCAMEEVTDVFDKGFSEQLIAEIKEARVVESNLADYTSELVKYKAQPVVSLFLYPARVAP